TAVRLPHRDAAGDQARARGGRRLRLHYILRRGGDLDLPRRGQCQDAPGETVGADPHRVHATSRRRFDGYLGRDRAALSSGSAFPLEGCITEMRDVAQGTLIVFDEVHKSFGQVHALWPTSLVVGAGEFLTLLGPSGSGKTTLLNIAAGYVPPDGGRVQLGIRDVTNLPPRQRNIGMVFQNYALFPHFDVFDNVAYGLNVRRRPNADMRTRVLASL